MNIKIVKYFLFIESSFKYSFDFVQVVFYSGCNNQFLGAQTSKLILIYRVFVNFLLIDNL